MKKRLIACLLLVALICLLLPGFTHIEKEMPSVFHGSTEIEVGGFTVSVPDYYESEDGNWVCRENGASAGAVLVISVEETDSSLKNFNKKKWDVMDNAINNTKRVAQSELTVAGCPAIIGDYITVNSEEYRMALLFDEAGKQLFTLVCVKAGFPSYDSYYSDFTEMVEGITRVGSGSASKAGSGSVSPEVKAFWDSYEAFVDEYVAFMKSYMKNPYDLTLLTKLSSYMSKLEDLEKKADAYTDSSSYSDADLAYSLEVYARVVTKLASVL